MWGVITLYLNPEPTLMSRMGWWLEWSRYGKTMFQPRAEAWATSRFLTLEVFRRICSSDPFNPPPNSSHTPLQLCLSVAEEAFAVAAAAEPAQTLLLEVIGSILLEVLQTAYLVPGEANLFFLTRRSRRWISRRFLKRTPRPSP